MAKITMNEFLRSGRSLTDREFNAAVKALSEAKKIKAKYSPELRAKAISMVTEEGRGQREVARELGIPKSTLDNWLGPAALPDNQPAASDRANQIGYQLLVMRRPGAAIARDQGVSRAFVSLVGTRIFNVYSDLVESAALDKATSTDYAVAQRLCEHASRSSQRGKIVKSFLRALLDGVAFELSQLRDLDESTFRDCLCLLELEHKHGSATILSTVPRCRTALR